MPKSNAKKSSTTSSTAKKNKRISSVINDSPSSIKKKKKNKNTKTQHKHLQLDPANPTTSYFESLYGSNLENIDSVREQLDVIDDRYNKQRVEMKKKGFIKNDQVHSDTYAGRHKKDRALLKPNVRQIGASVNTTTPILNVNEEERKTKSKKILLPNTS
jgi:hypothetical protein